MARRTDSDETRSGVAAQNALTRSIVDGPVRGGLFERLTRLYDYPRTGVPFARGNRLFFTHNTGLQDQPVLYVKDGVEAAPRILLDPNALHADGPVALPRSARTTREGPRVRGVRERQRSAGTCSFGTSKQNGTSGITSGG